MERQVGDGNKIGLERNIVYAEILFQVFFLRRRIAG